MYRLVVIHAVPHIKTQRFVFDSSSIRTAIILHYSDKELHNASKNTTLSLTLYNFKTFEHFVLFHQSLLSSILNLAGLYCFLH